MIHAGDVHLADLGAEQRWSVLVVSNDRFHRLTDRVLVAPRIEVEPAEVVAPWVIRVRDDHFALDLLRSVPSSRMLDRTGRASSAEAQQVRRALRLIT